LQNLKSDEVRSYISSLRYGSKPESALRESFIAGRSILLKYLFGEAMPEVRSDGFIDYLVKDEMGRGIALELKPLFEAEVVSDKSGKPILKRLRRKEIKPENYKDQILKYIREGEAQFVILTNLKEWFFYSKDLTPREVKPFCTISLFDFVKEYDVIGNLRDYLERKESESIRYELDRRFLESLKTWVEKLSEVEFTVDDRRKLELIIELINKFIFIQTLDDYGVIEFNWIRKRWNHHEQMWQRKGKLMVLEKFFNELDEWFFLYYDTELFREKILEYIKKDDGNIDKFYKNLQAVLGLTYLQMPLGTIRGIMQYNFRYIDEDVFGKAYETFLGEVRKEEGIYYTPKYITEYIVKNTVGRIFDELLKEIRERLDREDFKGARDLAVRFTSIKVLDPACGSGSFLIKAVRLIVEKYRELSRLIEDAEKNYVKKHSNYLSSLSIPQEIGEKLELISEIKKIVGPKNDRELISRILVRHIHGVDLDKRALEVAKVNIWLEAIKLAPKEFRYDRLPPETNYILPSLEMNLCCGDSLVGLPEEFTMKYINDKHQTDLIKLFDLRRKYLDDPTNPRLVEEIENIKHAIRYELNENFREYLEANSISTQILNQTKPFHWALEFWHAFFNENGVPLSEERQGFDVIIGNPPYIENKRLNTNIKRYLQNCGRYKTAYKLFDYAVPFIERAFQLLKTCGLFGYIVTNKFTVTDYGIKIREILAKNTEIEQILDVSYLPVFKGTAAYPIILIFRKIKIFNGHEVIIAPKVSSENDIIENKYGFIKIKQTTILQTPGYIFDLSGNTLLCEKIRSLGTVNLKRIANIGYRVLKFTGWNELLKYVVDQRPHAPHVKFIGCGNIEPYFINWGSKLLLAGRTFRNSYLMKPSQVDEDKWRILETPKILVREVGSRLTAALDQNGEYGNLTGMYMLYNIDQKYEPEFLLALLNSSLLDFYYKSLYGSTHMAGGYLNFHGSYIENLPILLTDACQQKSFVELANKVQALKKAHYKLYEIWTEWCTRLKNDEYPLGRILSEDAKFMRIGEFNKTWTSKATFYPTESKMLNTVFNDLKVVGEVDRHEIRIYGLDENNREELVYEMEFSNRDLMLHTYCSLLQALESRLKIKTLSQLFEKTKVPIIKEVNRSSSELTPNIVRKVKDEFEKWLKEERIEGVEADIVKIDNEIEDVEAKIDALVFKLYGLNEDEIKVVFDSLKTPAMYRSKVFEFFRKL
jgi:type I restriction-modification system DNA methylase subunit